MNNSIYNVINNLLADREKQKVNDSFSFIYFIFYFLQFFLCLFLLFVGETGNMQVVKKLLVIT